MRALTIVVSQGCYGSEKLRNEADHIGWEALGNVLSWVPNDPADPIARAHGKLRHPDVDADDSSGFPDLPALWKCLESLL